MTNIVETYLKFANLQMAAEALFEFNPLLPTGKAAPGATTSYQNIPIEYLKDGNNRSSRFTEVQADKFITDGWTVVEHISNKTTGFSGTLFKNILTDELVISFRSTEFADDAVRDNQATNTLEIKEKGWAFGQIADMQEWLESLYASDKISTADQLTVTGYSLGGHLATAFNLLYRSAVEATYTFNGAGVGELLNGKSLTQVMNTFTQRRALGGNADLFTAADVRAQYDRLKGSFTENAEVTVARIDEEMRSLVTQNLSNFAEQGLLYTALTRIRTVVAEAERINAGVTSGGKGGPALKVFTTSIAALGLDYQLAVLTASADTKAYSALNVFDSESGANNTLFDERNTVTNPIPNFHDVYAANYPSAVANSQLHYGQKQGIRVEDQPLHRGSYLAGVAESTALSNWDLKLLVPDFSQNDFGDTHSLVLIVDSLSVQHTLAQLDPDVSPGTLTAILEAASNKKAGTVILSQGKAEGDMLETIVKSLAAMFDVDIEPMAAKLDGGTWADPEDRAVFHRNIKAITESPAFQAIEGDAVIRTSGADLEAAARIDFGAVTALMTLSPFWIEGKGDAGKAALETAWEFVHGEDFLAWQDDKTAATPAMFTDQWIADRSRLLSALMAQGRQNSNTGQVYDTSVPADRVYEFKYIGGDIPQGQTQPVTQTLFAKARWASFFRISASRSVTA